MLPLADGNVDELKTQHQRVENLLRSWVLTGTSMGFGWVDWLYWRQGLITPLGHGV